MKGKETETLLKFQAIESLIESAKICQKLVKLKPGESTMKINEFDSKLYLMTFLSYNPNSIVVFDSKFAAKENNIN